MRIAIVQFPGSNCERETSLAVKRANMEPVDFLWNDQKEKLAEMDGYIIVGGFSYEDRSRAGIIAALDPVMQEIKIQSEKGKPVLGICNGAQILVETGLVPGLENHKVGIALTENKRVIYSAPSDLTQLPFCKYDEQSPNHQLKILGTGFYNAWVHVKLAKEYQRNAFTRELSHKDVMHIPVAHGEGRFVMTQALLDEVEAQGLNVFQYCDAAGNMSDHFPINPNGSMRSIAAISNKMGNVMAMMPHPERTTNGDAIFNSMRQYILDRQNELHHSQVVPLYYYPRRAAKLSKYQKSLNSYECTVELIISDNQALTVQNTLKQLGLNVTVKRQIHWEITCDSLETYKQIKNSGVLYNERKEVEMSAANLKQDAETSVAFLVRAKEDLLGQQKMQMLKDHFSIQGVTDINHGIKWLFYAKNAKIADLATKILQTNIIFNPFAHDCYQYE